jgi:uncharacterized membrane-anchored protein
VVTVVAVDTVIHGHSLLSDWLFLIAVIVALVAAIAAYVRQSVPQDWLPTLVPLALAFGFAAYLVL